MNDFGLKMLTEGYISFVFDSTNLIAGEKLVFVNKGEKYLFSKPENFTQINETATKFGNKKPLYPTTIFEIKNFLEQLIVLHENNGYPFVSIKIENLRLVSDTFTYSININPGKLIKFDTLLIKPDDIITSRYLSNVLDINKGDIYSEALVMEIKSKINRTGFLSLTKEPEVTIIDGKAKIVIELAKRKTGSFDGILGFSSTDDLKLEFTGNMNIDLINQLKKGERLILYYDRSAPRTQELSFETSIPYLLNTTTGLEYKMKFYRDDSSYISVYNAPGLSYQVDVRNKITIFYKNQQNNVLSNYSSSPDLLANSTSNTIGIGLLNNTSDDEFIPGSGNLTSIIIESGKKNLRDNDFVDDDYFETLETDLFQASAELNTRHFKSLSRMIKLEMQLVASSVYNQSLNEAELFRLGGIKNFKGIDDKSILASTFIYSNLEAKLLIESETYFSCFYNFGFFERNLKYDYKNGWLHGFGMGLNVHTGNGNMAIYLTMGQSYLNPISLRNSKIHFGYTAKF